MTNDFTVLPEPWLLVSNEYVNEIQNIFRQHGTVLNNERETAIDNINTWCREWIKDIKKYANEQKNLLDDYYSRFRPVFDEKYKENIETANAYYDAKQLDLFNELRDACQSLKFQVAILNEYTYKTKRLEIKTVEEQIARKNSNTTETNTRDDARRRRRLIKGHNNEPENNNSENTSTPSSSITSNSKQTNDVQSSKTKPKRKDNQSIDNEKDLKNQSMTSDESTNKCPVCLMIFPSSMKLSDRHQHVNEHMIDDQDTNNINT